MFFGEISPMTSCARRKFQATRPSIGPRAVPDSTDPVYPTKLGVLRMFSAGSAANIFAAVPHGDCTAAESRADYL